MWCRTKHHLLWFFLISWVFLVKCCFSPVSFRWVATTSEAKTLLLLPSIINEDVKQKYRNTFGAFLHMPPLNLYIWAVPGTTSSANASHHLHLGCEQLWVFFSDWWAHVGWVTLSSSSLSVFAARSLSHISPAVTAQKSAASCCQVYPAQCES